MQKINTLTADQIADMDEQAKTWLGIGLSTERIDREAAIGAVKLLYKCGGVEKPQQILCSATAQSRVLNSRNNTECLYLMQSMVLKIQHGFRSMIISTNILVLLKKLLILQQLQKLAVGCGFRRLGHHHRATYGDQI